MTLIFNKACLIVGAGASKGAQVSGVRTPPLDAEFLRVAKNLFGGKGNAKGLKKEGRAEWKGLLDSLKGIGIKADVLPSWRLETLATYLEARSQVKFENKSGRPEKYSNLLESLNRIVCYVLSLNGGLDTCPIHESMIANIKPNSIVSFNYDLILDQTLHKMGKLNWASHQYSPSPTASTREKQKFTTKRWLKNKRRPTQAGIPLYKLHGSMHWQKKAKDELHYIAGVKNFPPDSKFEYVKPPERPFIIAPVAAKISIPELQNVWKEAHKSLRAASCWIIWGYSFPQTDTITSVLLKTCVKDAKGKQKRVIIINPDYTVSARVKALLDKVKVEQFSSASDFLLKYGCLKFVDTNE